MLSNMDKLSLNVAMKKIGVLISPMQIGIVVNIVIDYKLQMCHDIPECDLVFQQ
jgi:hypothetical protein